MIFTRYTLKEHLDEARVVAIIRRVKNYPQQTFNKMIVTPDGIMLPVMHFRAIEVLDGMKKSRDTIQKRYLKFLEKDIEDLQNIIEKYI